MINKLINIKLLNTYKLFLNSYLVNDGELKVETNLYSITYTIYSAENDLIWIVLDLDIKLYGNKSMYLDKFSLTKKI